MRTIVILFQLFILFSSAARSAVMIQPVSISSATALFGTYQLDNLINQDGLSTTYVSGVTNAATYLATAPTQASNPLSQYAVMSEAASVVYEMDLGLTYNLTHLILWNGPDSVTTRVASFSVSVSSSPTFATSQNLGTYTSSPSAAHPVAAESFTLTEGLGRYVRFEVINDGGSRTLVGEVAFAGSIPEPSAALLVVFGSLALLRRSRRN